MNNKEKLMSFLPYAGIIIIFVAVLFFQHFSHSNDIDWKDQLLEKIAIEAEEKALKIEEIQAPKRELEFLENDRRSIIEWKELRTQEFKEVEKEYNATIDKLNDAQYKREKQIRCQRKFILWQHELDCSLEEVYNGEGGN